MYRTVVGRGINEACPRIIGEWEGNIKTDRLVEEHELDSSDCGHEQLRNAYTYKQ